LNKRLGALGSSGMSGLGRGLVSWGVETRWLQDVLGGTKGGVGVVLGGRVGPSWEGGGLGG
jgi:hypothetical protein